MKLENLIHEKPLLLDAFPQWFKDLKQSALQQAKTFGFPHHKVESWRFTPLRQLRDVSFSRINSIKPSTSHPFENVDWQDIEALWKGKTFHQGTFLDALNIGLINDVHVLRICENNTADTPVRLHFDTLEEVFNFSHLVIIVENGIEAHIELRLGNKSTKESHFLHLLTHVVLKENATLNLIEIKQAGQGETMLQSLHVESAKGSYFNHYNINLGGGFLREDINIQLNGALAQVDLKGLFTPRYTEYVDVHSQVNHNVPNCESHQDYRGILNCESHGVFNARVFIAKDAQKTNASQVNHNLLLSRSARINTNPQLEIYADDVKANHGSTVGELDDEALFYMQSRGINPDDAKRLLIAGFAGNIIETLGSENLKNELRETLDAWFDFSYTKLK
jgi:Fe-S cluster assembly protein SufD